MHRIDTATKAPDLFGAGKHGFRNGDQAGGIAATALDADFFNSMQEEIVGVVEGAGLTLDKADRTQLRTAILAMMVSAGKSVVVDGATFEASVADGEVVRWDSGNSLYDEAVADGTANNRAVGVADVTNGKVYLFGECPIFSGLTPGARYYLDATTPGAITVTAPTDAVFIGTAKSATTLWVDVDAAGASIVGQVNSWSKAQRGAIVALTDAATVAVDLSLANNFSLTLGGNRTLGNPTNIVPGQSGIIAVTQDGTGSRTLAYSSYWKFPNGTAPTLTTTASATDYLAYYVETATRIYASLIKDVK